MRQLSSGHLPILERIFLGDLGLFQQAICSGSSLRLPAFAVQVDPSWILTLIFISSSSQPSHSPGNFCSSFKTQEKSPSITNPPPPDFQAKLFSTLLTVCVLQLWCSREKRIPMWWDLHVFHWRRCRRHNRHAFNLRVGHIPWSRILQATPIFLPGEFHGQKSLVGCSPWGRNKSDTTEQLSTHTGMPGTSLEKMTDRIPWFIHPGTTFLVNS